MTYIDVFNGDADGICALHQLRLADPVEKATLITGVKRDIALLRRVKETKDCTIIIVDVSLDKNREELVKLLDNGNRILYVDHHFAGEIPQCATLEHHIEASAKTCSSLIANTLIKEQYPKWAICGAYGDNLNEQAEQLAQGLGLASEEQKKLKEIGELFNYNGYGSEIEDLHFHPAELYRAIKPFSDPLEFHASTEIIDHLREGYASDMAQTVKLKDVSGKPPHRIYMLPAAPWARRVVGVFSNRMAREKKDGAHAIIVNNDDGSMQISVRAPLTAKKNADTLCRQFPTGGGRAAAAGINKLPASMLDDFIDAFHQTFEQAPPAR